MKKENNISSGAKKVEKINKDTAAIERENERAEARVELSLIHI